MTTKNYTTPSGYEFSLSHDANGIVITSQHAPTGAHVKLGYFQHPDHGNVEGLTFFAGEGKKRLLIRLHCPEAMADINACRAEAAARQAAEDTHKHTIMLVGWESHEVTVDDRHLEADAAKYAERYGHDGITVNSVMEAYQRHLARQAANTQRVLDNARRVIDVEVPRAERAFGHVPTPAELAAWQRKFNDLNNEGGEGYVPSYCTTESVARAEKLLAEANKK